MIEKFIYNSKTFYSQGFLHFLLNYSYYEFPDSYQIMISCWCSQTQLVWSSSCMILALYDLRRVRLSYDPRLVWSSSSMILVSYDPRLVWSSSRTILALCGPQLILSSPLMIWLDLVRSSPRRISYDPSLGLLSWQFWPLWSWEPVQTCAKISPEIVEILGFENWL